MTELWRKPATEIAALVKSREVSALEVVDSALSRLASVNPGINAVVAEFPDEARAEARKIDEAVGRGDDMGPLAGVPITVKINVDQAGHTTTNGLKIQRDLKASVDNPVVANLRKAGAVIIGRTNTPAFSLRWFTRNDLHGHTRNPWNSAITPGGSSGGAGAAVASGIGAIAHGTDIAGSVRYPAYACGVHGLRPSLGRVPAANFTGKDRYIGPQLMAVSGPLARTIADVRLAFHAMAARDERDPWQMPVPLDLGPLPKRAALCVAPDGLKTSPEVVAALRDAAKRLQAAGWDVVERESPPLRRPVELQLMLWIADHRRGGGQAARDEGDPDANFVYAQMEKICPAPDLNGFMDALQERVGLMRQWNVFLKEYPVLLCPVSGEPPFPDQLDVQSPEAFKRVWEAQLPQIGVPFMGLPGLTVTTGINGNVPIGVMLVGAQFREIRQRRPTTGINGNVPIGVMLVGAQFREELLLQAGEAIERGGPPLPYFPEPA